MKNICLIDNCNPPYTKELLSQKALGGSETVFLLLSEELGKLCNLTVLYSDYQQHVEQSYDAVIAYRDPAPLFRIRSNLAAALYLQDLPNPSTIQQIRELYRTNRINKLIFLSHYQKEQYLSQIPEMDEGRHVIMLENGIDLSLFDSSIEKRNVALYASAPNRGLDVLLEIWPILLNLLPGWELHIAGSTTMYNVPDNEQNEQREELLADGNDLYKTEHETIRYLGGLTHVELIREMESAKMLLYPNTFIETSSHVVNMALHAGCVPVTSRLGALAEKITNGENGILIDGDPKSQAYKQQFVQAVLQGLQSGTIERMSRTNRGMYTGYSIDKQARRLLLHLCQHDEFEGRSYRIYAACCSLKGNNKKQFRNLSWYSPLDVMTDEIVGLPIDQARNVAANVAVQTGADYLLFLDDDIYVSRTFVQDMLKIALKNHADVIVADYPYKDRAELVSVTRIVDTDTNRSVLSLSDLSDGELNGGKYRFVTSGLGACLISTEALKTIGRPYFRTHGTMKGRHTGEDSYFFQECWLNDLKVYITKQPIIHRDAVGNNYGWQIDKVLKDLAI